MSTTAINKDLINRKELGLETKYPIKVIQFGEGNFLRAFVDYAIQKLNENADFNAGVAVVQPIDRGLINMLNDQEGLYTLFLKGIKQGKEIQSKEVISNIVAGIDPFLNFDGYLSLAEEKELQFIISNTTEAGIVYDESDRPDMAPPKSFPAKLTVLLHRRFKHFDGDLEKGCTIIPCELINYNAETLRDIILRYIADWNLGEEFKSWIENACSFHSTLVDRIVPGYPRAEIESYNSQLDYHDNLIVTAETFLLWVIEGGDALKAKLPFEKTQLDVKIVEDMQPYRTRKVRILNGAHTSMVPFSLLFGNTTVKETVEDEFTGKFVHNAIFEEIIPTLDMDKDELELFANEVLDRFRNPFIIHNLADIALNSISKFKVRVLPSIVEYYKIHNSTPVNLTFAFACLIRFYQGEFDGNKTPIKDSEEMVSYFANVWKSPSHSEIANEVLGNTNLWDVDLSQNKDLVSGVTKALECIDASGIEKGYEEFRNSSK